MHLILQVFYNQMFTKYAAILNIHHKYLPKAILNAFLKIFMPEILQNLKKSDR